MNKKILGLIFVLVLGTWCLAPRSYAKPEQLMIKNENRQIQEGTAKAHLRAIDLSAIEDPEARKAIREILNYLNLKAKN